MLLAHDGALRREEIVQLRVDDIDWRTPTIPVRAEISKNQMPGTIVLSHPTWTRLKEYLEEDRAALAATFGAEANGPIQTCTQVAQHRNKRAVFYLLR